MGIKDAGMGIVMPSWVQMKNLAIIPARGGSKGLPGKNIRPLGGRPLMAWTIQAAQAAGCVSSVVVSSDDQAILAVAEQWGAPAPFMRPPRLAQDDSSNIEVVFHALDYFKRNGQIFEAVTLLQPTSPLRTAADIEAAFAIFESTGAPACLSVTAFEHPPQWSCLIQDRRLRPLMPQSDKRRQDLEPCYRPNGAIYIAKPDWLRAAKSFFTEETVAYVMPLERSVDIDGYMDFLMAERLASLSAEELARLRNEGFEYE